jgi:glutamate--cysteine ligase
MVRKFRVALALQPVATALFASSPFAEGQPNGFKSLRSEIWRNTDRARTGMLPFVFEPGMGFERYVEYALGVPMYFVYRDGNYIDVAGASFRDFLAGKLPQLPGERPTIDDWSDHLTTLFPEVRMKRFLETRGADSGRSGNIKALPAFFVGLLYDTAALDAASDLIRDWTAEERDAMREAVPHQGLDTSFRKGKLLDVAREAVTIARLGLANRRRLDAAGQDETRYLAAAETVVKSGRSEADRLLTHYHADWSGSVTPIYRDYRF